MWGAQDTEAGCPGLSLLVSTVWSMTPVHQTLGLVEWMQSKARVVNGYCITTIFTRVTRMVSFTHFHGAHIIGGHTALEQ